MEGEGFSGTLMKAARTLKRLRTSLSLPIRMSKDDPKKPKGKMSAYAFFVQTCREEHKKKSPEVHINFIEFSKRCSDRWKIMSSKEKSKFEEMAKADKVRYDREMKQYHQKRSKKRDPNPRKRPLSGFFLFCSKFRPQIKSTTPGITVGALAKKLGEMWSNLSETEKQSYKTKAAKLKDKYEQNMVGSSTKGKCAASKGPGKATCKSVKRGDDDDDDDEEEEEEEDANGNNSEENDEQEEEGRADEDDDYSDDNNNEGDDNDLDDNDDYDDDDTDDEEEEDDDDDGDDNDGGQEDYDDDEDIDGDEDNEDHEDYDDENEDEDEDKDNEYDEGNDEANKDDGGEEQQQHAVDHEDEDEDVDDE